MLLIVLLGAGLMWVTINIAGELRDWLDSDTWLATQSTELILHNKTSQVQYAYKVAGQSYTGERTHFFVTAPFQDRRHLQWLNANRRADAATVYYDPDAPERAVLVRGLELDWLMQTPLILGYVCFMILLPVIFFGFLWRWLRRQIFSA